MTLVYRLAENIYRIRHYNTAPGRESLLTKYHLLNTEPEGKPEVIYEGESNLVTLEAGYRLDLTLSSDDAGGFDVKLPLDKSDRLFGLGDESRDCLEKHGKIAVMAQMNVRSYGPIPYLMSSRGWALFMANTYPHTYDIAATDKDLLHIFGDKGCLDLFVVTGTDLHNALYLAGKITGRPVMLPKAGYGLTFVMNEDTTARTLLEDSLKFRDHQIPCDILGLEPSWMEKFYDSSTEKKWNKDRFYIPYWHPENYYGSWSFIWNLHQTGRALSLWLCCEYDLFWKEEGDAVKAVAVQEGADNFVINDHHLTKGRRMDKVTKEGEDWFEHLKKFVDNGAEAFKLDGAYQIIPFPDRLWAGKYTDDEIRNIYPLVYAKQMKEGFQNHTGRRAMINTCGSYLGIQKYAATWAGDTGCDEAVILSIMNFAMSGHSNASFDMSCDEIEKIHVGFLAPWSQHLGWANWTFPWFCGDEAENAYRYYAQLRSSLFPYIYAYAHVASETSLPILRPLALAYPHTDAYDTVYNEYMLGDAFLVSAFDRHIHLPEEDDWYDFYTGKMMTGPRQFTYELPKERGGAVYVRAGSVVVRQDWANSLKGYRPDKLYIHAYIGQNKKGSFTLWEDDYSTYAYETGEGAKTPITLDGNVLTIGMREGSYADMPEVNSFDVIFHRPDGSEKVYAVTAEAHKAGVVVIKDI